MKAMWNLMHVMQVLAYMLYLLEWPANTKMMLEAIKEATTLVSLSSAFYKTIDLVDEDNEDEDLSNSEVAANQTQEKAEKNVLLSIGVFGVSFAVILILVMVYLVSSKLISKTGKCRSCCIKFEQWLKDKLNYSLWIRLVIESFLMVTHAAIFYLFIFGSVDQDSESMTVFGTVFWILVLVFFAIFPILSAAFLIYQRE